MACLYKRHTKFWVAFYLEGRLVRRSLATDNERVARAKMRRLEYELSLGDLHQASKLPVPVILSAFCDHLQVTRTFKSYKNDISRLRIFFGPICDALVPGTPGPSTRKVRRPARDKYTHVHVKADLLEDITPEMINRFLSARIKHDSWAAKTANSMRQVLFQLFNYATKHHGFRARDRRYPNPAAGVDRRREPAPQIRFLSLAQIDQQLAGLEDHPLIRAMVAVYIFAGLRREEGVWLTPDDVDHKARLLRVRAKTIQGESWQPKTKRNRVVPISDALTAVLETYLPQAGDPWFFPSPAGKRWHPDNFSQDLRAINEALGLDWSCADYRHTFGSHLAQKGESLYKIAELMGNSPEICRRHYAALIPEKMHDVVEFSIGDKQSEVSDNGVKSMLKEVLDRLKSNEGPDENGPELYLVR